MEPLSSCWRKVCMYGVQPGKEGVVKVGFMAARPKSSTVFCRRSKPRSRDVAAWLVRPLQWNATTNIESALVRWEWMRGVGNLGTGN
jgi:hypothetical protein